VLKITTLVSLILWLHCVHFYVPCSSRSGVGNIFPEGHTLIWIGPYLELAKVSKGPHIGQLNSNYMNLVDMTDCFTIDYLQAQKVEVQELSV